MSDYKFEDTIIQEIAVNNNNKYFIKRDDLIPYSFGGNKVRIAIEYIKDMKKKQCDCMVAYGNSRSNLCRVLSNMCYSENIDCYIISPTEDDEEYFDTNNSIIVNSIVKDIFVCKKNEVPETIENTLKLLRDKGYKPYYIYNEENEKCTFNAYIKAYNEIVKFEKNNNIYFDYIFLPSGTSMTQTGLVCGQILNEDKKRKIIGISNARMKERGKGILDKNILNFIKDHNLNTNIKSYPYEFIDEYVLNGYGKYNENIVELVKNQFYNNGLPLDLTYTGKAFWGMTEYLYKNEIVEKNILFIHTGGTPLFFDNIQIFKNK